MFGTSIQNIISINHSTSNHHELQNLFQDKQYPVFELSQLSKNKLSSKEVFRYFLGLLQKWNTFIREKGPKCGRRDEEYHKNEFIYSSLKNVAVQSSEIVAVKVLNKLYDWYSQTQDKDIQCAIKGANVKASRLQEWHIKNSYQSNLPLQIDSYKRRLLFPDYDENDDEKKDKENIYTKMIENKKKKQQKIVGKIYNIGISNIKKQNNYLRNQREFLEVQEEKDKWRKTKMLFYKTMPKNFYKNQYSRDKIMKPPKEASEKLDSSLIIKDYRIKTSLGNRPFGSEVAKFGNKNGELDPRKTCTKFMNFQKQEENSIVDQNIGGMSQYFASFSNNSSVVGSIDGLKLMTNPFQVKNKKKNKPKPKK